MFMTFGGFVGFMGLVGFIGFRALGVTGIGVVSKFRVASDRCLKILADPQNNGSVGAL